MLSTGEWVLLVVDIGVCILAILVTNRRSCPRVLRILARNAFLLSFLILSYHLLAAVFTQDIGFFPRASTVKPVVTSESGSSIVGGPSLSADFVNQVLERAGSPAAGTGQALYDLSVKYQIDNAYALATFQQESTYGKYGAAVNNRSLGNIICAGYPTCKGRFRSYATWEEGYEDFYRLIAQEYVPRGLKSVDAILPVYAPSTENNTVAYIQAVRRAMSAYRSGSFI